MMKLAELVAFACTKENFQTVEDYVNFFEEFATFAVAGNVQAVIVAQNAHHYQFVQYKEDGHYNVTRPINSNLWYSAENIDKVRTAFPEVLANARDIPLADSASRSIICRSIYSIQQAIGSALDGLPAGQSNTARKINGDLFERLIRLLIADLGVDCTSGVINVPVQVDGEELFTMRYQHDLIIRSGEIKVIGSVKTSSKDRIDKIFIDKFLYSRLTGTDTPHIAIFLNDVQRKGKHPRYGISATFLPGHFKGYTVRLNPLDGVYYCDIRPNMITDALLQKHIRTIDHLFCFDLWEFLESDQGTT